LPAGAKLRVRDLSERYGVGTIPVREALSRLCNTGFVEAVDQRGFRVAPVSVEELRDITRVRQHLESLALREAIHRKDPAWEASVISAFHKLKHIPVSSPQLSTALNPEWEEAHQRFHAVLIEGARSPTLQRFCRELRDQTTRYRALSLGAPHSCDRDVQAEHAAIVDAILKRDADEACRQLTEHFSITTELVLEVTMNGTAAS